MSVEMTRRSIGKLISAANRFQFSDRRMTDMRDSLGFGLLVSIVKK